LINPQREKEILMAFLTIVAFMAGSAWAPTVIVVPLQSLAACEVMREKVGDTIFKAARTNVNGLLEKANGKEGDLLITAGQMCREIARLSCSS
jgi:hypothetical protein